MFLIRVLFWCKLVILVEDSFNIFKECFLVVRGLLFCVVGVGFWWMEVLECWFWDVVIIDVGLMEWVVIWCGDVVFLFVVIVNVFWDILLIFVFMWNIVWFFGLLLVFVFWYNGLFYFGWLSELIFVFWRKGLFNVFSWFSKWGIRVLL